MACFSAKIGLQFIRYYQIYLVALMRFWACFFLFFFCSGAKSGIVVCFCCNPLRSACQKVNGNTIQLSSPHTAAYSMLVILRKIASPSTSMRLCLPTWGSQTPRGGTCFFGSDTTSLMRVATDWGSVAAISTTLLGFAAATTYEYIKKGFPTYLCLTAEKSGSAY